MATPSTIIRKPYEAVAGALEEVGRQLGFAGKVLLFFSALGVPAPDRLGLPARDKPLASILAQRLE